MDEKVIIKSEQYNFKSYWITVLVIAGLSLLLAIPNIDWDWFLRRPFDWIIEEGWTNIFFDIMLITLIVGTIAISGFVKCNLLFLTNAYMVRPHLGVKWICRLTLSRQSVKEP